MNILKATLFGMNQALENVQAEVDFDFVLIDGDQFHGYKDKSYTTIVGGDNKYTSIAAASILAKVSRDNLMKSLKVLTEQVDKTRLDEAAYNDKLIAKYGPFSMNVETFEITINEEDK